MFLLYGRSVCYTFSPMVEKYSTEAFHLLSQTQAFLTPRMAYRVIWGRFVNLHGSSGHNISCNLHLEHLNNTVKSLTSRLGPNLTDITLARVSCRLKSVL